MIEHLIDLLGGIGATLFCLVYGVGAAWYRTLEGRNVLGMMAALAFLFDEATVYAYFVTNPIPPAWLIDITDIVAAAIVYLIWRRLWLMIKAQVEGKDDTREED